MNQKQNNFMDTRTIIAIVLVGIVWFAWQSYLTKKYPNMNQPQQKVENAQKLETTPPTSTQESPKSEPPISKTEVKAADVASEEKTLVFQNDDISFEVSSAGMGIKKVVLKKHQDREKKAIQFAQDATVGLFAATLTSSGKAIPFSIEKKADNVFEGTARVGESTIRRTIEIQPQTLALKNTVVIEKASALQGLGFSISEKKLNLPPSSMFAPSTEQQESFVHYSGKRDRINMTSTSEPVQKSYQQVSIASVGTHYFTAALLDKSDLAPEASVIATSKEGDPITAQMTYKFAAESAQLNFQAYAGPKLQENLEKIDPLLTETIDFGFFSGIAKVLLITMKWFYRFVGNWGVAIILLTLLVRALVLPFNIASYKSMKKMQKIQPQIQSLRERYKEDANAMNREMMDLMKKEKVNPLGGCLPMLLQMPVFFALYQVLGQSIELYQAPFMLWIQDLSLKDPYYVLPILMGVSLFIQHKITPTTMDPTQAKVMQFMPIMFSLMMIALPSGLTLYIFVSTAFGIIQQQLFMRDKSPALSTKAMKA
ncbi:MAG: membrane protein insertase YidC [Oligoflexia bacterium]|nr:MAG: membrane protein insertase YidC [Oligoflexia bacterium]